MKPVLVIPGTSYVICFEAADEDVDMRRHFTKECGWSAKQFREIKDFAWFTAEVSLWYEGDLLGTEYLGCCCYKNADEFWTTYAADYFSDKVYELVSENVPGLQLWAKNWRVNLRKEWFR